MNLSILSHGKHMPEQTSGLRKMVVIIRDLALFRTFFLIINRLEMLRHKVSGIKMSGDGICRIECLLKVLVCGLESALGEQEWIRVM